MKNAVLLAAAVAACAFAAETKTVKIEELLRSKKAYDQKTICLKGAADLLDAKISRRGKPYFTFRLADGDYSVKNPLKRVRPQRERIGCYRNRFYHSVKNPSKQIASPSK